MWKDIKGYEGIYQINEFGIVKSFAQYKQGKIKKQQIDKHGYATILLYKNGLYKKYFIHRLVLSTFSPCENMNKLHVNHKDASCAQQFPDCGDYC